MDAHRDRGLTLLELALTAVIFAAVLAVAYPAFHSANDTIATSNRRDVMERHGDRLLGEVRDFLREGRITSTPAANAPPEIRLVRVPSGLSLDEISEVGSIPWDSTEEAIRFRTKREIRESEIGEDLNGDGDRADRFAIGVLETEDSRGVRPITETGEVMLGLPSYAGDLDGDGVADPLFEVDERSVEIRIRLLARTAAGHYLKTELRGTLRLRNRQD